MAYILAKTDDREAGRLVAAGYEFEDVDEASWLGDVESKLDDDGDFWVLLYVDCNISELLSPALCPRLGCGTIMTLRKKQLGETGSMFRRCCPACGAEIITILP